MNRLLRLARGQIKRKPLGIETHINGQMKVLSLRQLIETIHGKATTGEKISVRLQSAALVGNNLLHLESLDKGLSNASDPQSNDFSKIDQEHFIVGGCI